MNGLPFISEVFQSRPNLQYEFERAYTYGATGRHYHNMHHILELLFLQEKYFPDMDFHGKIAILFHDIFYIPGSICNESLSARVCLEYTTMLKMPDDYVWSTTSAIIRATDHKDSPSNLNGERLETLKQVLDLDLAGLGSDRYKTNGLRVQAEFLDYTDEEWLVGRKKFLEFFLAKDRIFKTDLGQKLWEAPARINLMDELQELEKM